MQLTDAVRRYMNAMMAVGRSPYTLRGAKSGLKTLVAFLSSVGVEAIEQITHEALLRYLEALSWHVTDKGTPLTARSQSELLGHLRAFCRWMVAQDWLVSDPSKRIPIRGSPNNSRRRSWTKRKFNASWRNPICRRHGATGIA